jgi:hypothetical protein
MHIVVMHLAIFFLASPLSGGFVGIWMPPILGSSRGLAALDYFFASTRKDGVGVLVEKLLAWVANDLNQRSIVMSQFHTKMWVTSFGLIYVAYRC